ncbi:MAG TPA: tRNA (adenosine(37)-N6)-threonylcarbamoyltransferase complex ATPase subunit type 1 TsaE [Candidatus Paceibacterota bacterium]|nr:tRNA (adenosine(37)-N6)-threonylcarbamoyltransferase complex ATPase subunit type 1 TsaE [Candidatus Paceibacterota bacterium]
MHLVSQSPEDTRAIAARFAAQWKVAMQGRAGALVIALIGELGAGKTAFVQGVAHALGIREIPRSPTFNLAKSYAIPGTQHRLWHLDCYRLQNRNDLRALDVHTIFADYRNLVLVEWADRVPGALPSDHTIIRMAHAGGDKRSFSMDEHPQRT